MTPNIKAKILLACELSMFLGSLCTSVLVSILPYYVKKKNKQMGGIFNVSQSDQAWIIAIFNLS